MRNTAVVTSLSGGDAVVELRRTSACGGNCGACGGCANANAPQRFLAQNPLQAAVGDRVTVEISARAGLGAAVWVFLLPVALLTAGLFFSPLVAFALFALGLGLAVGVDRLRKKRPARAVIVWVER